MELYKITAEFNALIADFDGNTDDEFLSKLNGLNADFQSKANNCISYALNLKAQAAAIKAHCDDLTAKRKTYEQRADKLLDYVLHNMKAVGLTEIKDSGGLYTAKVAKNPPSVNVLNADEISSEFVKVEQVSSIDKKAILQHFKATGEIVAGVEIVTDKQRLSIK